MRAALRAKNSYILRSVSTHTMSCNFISKKTSNYWVLKRIGKDNWKPCVSIICNFICIAIFKSFDFFPLFFVESSRRYESGFSAQRVRVCITQGNRCVTYRVAHALLVALNFFTKRDIAYAAMPPKGCEQSREHPPFLPHELVSCKSLGYSTIGPHIATLSLHVCETHLSHVHACMRMYRYYFLATLAVFKFHHDRSFCLHDVNRYSNNHAITFNKQTKKNLISSKTQSY